jgi:prepilin-type N-terminal cleavage/methylation domain
MKKNAGFTLIELVAVMVILAILAVVAVPQFVDLRVQAADSAAAGVGGAISSASAMNYAAGAAGNGDAVTPVLTCNAAGALVIGGVPSDYTVADVTVPTAAGKVGTCSIIHKTVVGATAQEFSIIGN